MLNGWYAYQKRLGRTRSDATQFWTAVGDNGIEGDDQSWEPNKFWISSRKGRSRERCVDQHSSRRYDILQKLHLKQFLWLSPKRNSCMAWKDYTLWTHLIHASRHRPRLRYRWLALRMARALLGLQLAGIFQQVQNRQNGIQPSTTFIISSSSQ